MGGTDYQYGKNITRKHHELRGVFFLSAEYNSKVFPQGYQDHDPDKAWKNDASLEYDINKKRKGDQTGCPSF